MPRTKHIYQLVYCLSCPKNLQSNQIDESIFLARSFNQQHNITGCIVLHNNEFYNLFEGEDAAIENLHRFVVNNNLGKHITIVYKQDVATRFFTQSFIVTDSASSCTESTHLSLPELKTVISDIPGQTSATKVFNQIITQLILEESM